SLPFPFVLRGGVEVRPTAGLRLEAAYVWEQWSRQKRLRVAPKNVWIRDVTAIGDYEVGKVDYPRRMNDTHSVRVGGEHTGFVDGRLALRAGLEYETSSFDDAYLTALTLDTSKVVLGIGVGFEVVEGLWLDASYGHVFLEDRNVDNSRVPQPTPLRPPPAMDEEPPTGPVHVGNGKYDMEADLIGIGLRWQVEPPETASETETETETESKTEAEPGTEQAPWWDRDARSREQNPPEN
ncbi:MAG: OmpP1/FadL family transporter, partial [Polyangiales bacterium]